MFKREVTKIFEDSDDESESSKTADFYIGNALNDSGIALEFDVQKPEVGSVTEINVEEEAKGDEKIGVIEVEMVKGRTEVTEDETVKGGTDLLKDEKLNGIAEVTEEEKVKEIQIKIENMGDEKDKEIKEKLVEEGRTDLLEDEKLNGIAEVTEEEKDKEVQGKIENMGDEKDKEIKEKLVEGRLEVKDASQNTELYNKICRIEVTDEDVTDSCPLLERAKLKEEMPQRKILQEIVDPEQANKSYFDSIFCVCSCFSK